MEVQWDILPKQSQRPLTDFTIYLEIILHALRESVNYFKQP